MRAQREKILLIAGGVVALIAIAAVAAPLLLDINRFKSEIESAAFDATGLYVRINGKMGFSLSPLGLSAKEIHVAGKDGEILSLENLKLGLKLAPLLKKKIEVTGCELVKPTVNVVKDNEGIYNFEKTEKKSMKWKLNVAGLTMFRLSKGTLVHIDKKTGKKTELNDFNLAIKDLSIGNSPGNIIKNASLAGIIDCSEVVQNDLRIVNLRTAVKAAKGIYNFQPLAVESLVYIDRKSGGKAELEGLHLIIRDLSVADTSGGMIENVSFTGNLDCKELRCTEVRKGALDIGNVKSPIRVENGVIHLTSLTMDIFGARGEGDATADKSKADAEYKINLKVKKLDFEKLEKTFGTQKAIGGKGDLYASLTMKERGSSNLLSSIEGTVSLRGDNLVIYIMDLDKVLSAYGSTEEFNLVDLSAFLIAGPPGNIALKDLYNKSWRGRGIITHFISNWKINGGVAEATDCAFATHHNRVALKGKLDLVRERYDNVIVALLDDKGCARFTQSISGPIDNPQISTVSAVGSLAGPLVDLYSKAKRLIQGGKCKVFYSGSVQQAR